MPTQRAMYGSNVKIYENAVSNASNQQCVAYICLFIYILYWVF